MSRPRALSDRQRNTWMFRLHLLRALGLRHSVRRALANRHHRSKVVDRHDPLVEEIWRQAAAELGAEVRRLSPDLLEIRAGVARTRVRGQTTAFADPVSEALASDKPLAYRLLAEAGVPTPPHRVVAVADVALAERALTLLGGHCIVKPARGRGGNGVTGEVRSPVQLRRALVSAGRYWDEALLERQCPGDSYRVLVLDGEVLDIIRRPRPRVTGDGRSTLAELMHTRYRDRIADAGPAGLKPFMVDLDCLFNLEQAGYGLASVLPSGTTVTIKTATNFNGPEETLTVFPPYPEPVVGLAQQAAAALGIRLGGVDLMAGQEDPVVLEVNPIPGLTHHYNVADAQRAPRIAVPILDALLGAGDRCGTLAP